MEIPLNLCVGELTGRPNRFIFEGISEGKARRWHCPATGKIGLIDNFRGIPCLFTPAVEAKKRSTQGTVEAISLNGGKDWIGINQNRINGWVEYFLGKNALPEMIPTEGCSLRHEVQIGDSRIDLVVENGEKCVFLELKTPIHDLLLSPGDHFSRPPSATFFDRGLRHFQTLAQLAKAGHRAIVALCFMYDAVPFSPPERNKWNAKIIDTIGEANAQGVENWQLNFKISPNKLAITSCFKRELAHEKLLQSFQQ
ncbi:MAG: DNA/RNA nuclease SfsA [Puniceicoccales bacterium]|jgi:sugar fermentation stimulation protein A|nr:DNA/RNA nuclease SfsA [Puniceicoccales bacterium]